jgi:hypothetical protein
MLLLFISNPTFASFNFTPDAQKAYKLAIQLRLDESAKLCKQIRENEPENLIPLYIENYIDFFTILINEDYKEFKTLEKVKKKRVQLIKAGDQKSPYYRLILGEINLLWSIARLKFDEKARALLDANSAYRYLTENQQIFPEFIPTKKSLSMIHVMAESIPGIFKKFLSIEGSIKQGTDEIREVVNYAENNEFLFHEEALAIYAYILYSQNNRPEEAWKALNSSEKLKDLESPLATFLFAFFAQKTGRNDTAIQILTERPENKAYNDFHYLDFMLGKSLLFKLDPTSESYINSYLSNFKGRHYKKEAYQKLAWYELIVHDNIPGYKNHMNNCQNGGYKLVDGDKQAFKEAKRKNIPNPILLKARLLFDGGYFQKAQYLLVKNAHLFKNGNAFELEYLYRSGRISQALKNYTDALEYYGATLKKAKSSRSYLICNAALQMGVIYESQYKNELAEKYYKLCIDLDPEDYKNSLHQKAKSGLERIHE